MPTKPKEPSRAADFAETPFDLIHLDAATFGDRSLAREVLTLFDRQAAVQMAAIAAASDPRARREAAHTLKGAARGIGAKAVADAAAEIESAGDDPIEMIGALARLSARVAQARLAVADLLAGY